MQRTHDDTTTNGSIVRVAEPATTGGGFPACASCRHQRKKCTEKCVLAPFFPAEKNQDFQAVHKVFGVSNVTKLVKGLSVEEGKKAVDSLIWEANCRLNDPVLGPLGEFQRVSEELRFYKSQYHQVANMHHNIRQGAVLYNKQSAQQQRVIGSWNGDNNHNHNEAINNGSMFGYMNGNVINGGGIDNSRVFNYGASQNMEKLKQERNQEHAQIINDFTQFY